MPRKGSAYPIDAAWKRAVTDAYTTAGITQNELARRAKISKAALSEALSTESVQSTCVPEIHRALGWPMPRPPLMPPDERELLAMWDGMDPLERGRALERMKQITEDRRKK